MGGGIDQDAPDITVTVGDNCVEIELTALTAGALRVERRRLSDVAGRVRDAIAGQTGLSAALAGWTVDLIDAAALVLPLDVTEFELLAVFGCGELPPTRHVKRAWLHLGAWLHLAGTTELIALIRVAEPG